MSVTDEMSRITKTSCSVLTAIERLELLNNVYNMDDDTPLYQKRMIDGHMVESFSLKECEAQGRSTKSCIVPGQLSFGQYEKNIGNVIKVGICWPDRIMCPDIHLGCGQVRLLIFLRCLVIS